MRFQKGSAGIPAQVKFFSVCSQGFFLTAGFV
jgi:hypothetical protein